MFTKVKFRSHYKINIKYIMIFTALILNLKIVFVLRQFNLQ
ncbi:hypothetical protein Stok01_00556 [Sulfurisphaera tokodaii]|uniref:Uncharacterized protein n=1 Tax=Sulfurisphaera ohwakuensis TaxID=69656 RepID=A0A7J9RTB1_SULOH|nr:hypothetical protein [Sulfurisphaera ohwakuensis]